MNMLMKEQDSTSVLRSMLALGSMSVIITQLQFVCVSIKAELCKLTHVNV